MQQEEPLVTVKCMTFNHGPYISQCLEGFVKQKTDFKVQVLVHDDASTDQTAAIVREYAQKYPELITAICEEENCWNKHDGSGHAHTDALIKGKYLAICEGDDYWTDPLKLQKQVDYFAKNPGCSLCHTFNDIFIQQKQTIIPAICKADPPADQALYQLLTGENFISTLTVMMPTGLYLNYREEIKPQFRGWYCGDLPMWLYMAHCGTIGLVPEVTAVYRQLDKSACHTSSAKSRCDFIKSYHEIQKFFADRYGIEIPAWNQKRANYNICYKYLRNHYSAENLQSFREAYQELPPEERGKFSHKLANLCAGNSWLFKGYYFIKKHL